MKQTLVDLSKTGESGVLWWFVSYIKKQKRNLGNQMPAIHRLSFLIKLIDAKDNLSI